MLYSAGDYQTTRLPEIVEMLLDDEKLGFFRKLDGTVPSLLAKLKYENVSASLGNYRQKREENSKLPVEIFY